MINGDKVDKRHYCTMPRPSMIRTVQRFLQPYRPAMRRYHEHLRSPPVVSRFKLQTTSSRPPCDCSRQVSPTASATLLQLNTAILLLSPVGNQQLFLEPPSSRPESSEQPDKPRNYQHPLKLAAHRLQHSFPELLSGKHDFSLYAPNVTFEDRINGLTISGLGPLKVSWLVD
jgi:hypothetical protein